MRIQQLTTDYEAQTEKEMAEYKESFFQTGGTKEEWADRTMDLYIDYDVKYLSNDVLSLGVTTAKSWVSADEEHTYYNIDLKNDKELTLQDVLGDDYAAICNKSIVSQIEERMAADANAFFFGYGDSTDETDSLGKFETVDANTSFYLNAEGKVVISFPEYSIAGYMGIQGICNRLTQKIAKRRKAIERIAFLRFHCSLIPSSLSPYCVLRLLISLDFAKSTSA